MSIDPREIGPKPPFPKQEQTHPGTVKNSIHRQITAKRAMSAQGS
jgi:hypothetical protein